MWVKSALTCVKAPDRAPRFAVTSRIAGGKGGPYARVDG